MLEKLTVMLMSAVLLASHATTEDTMAAKSAQDVTEQLMQAVMPEAFQSPAPESVQESAPEISQESSENPALEASQESSEDPSLEVSKEPSEDPSPEVSQELSGDPAPETKEDQNEEQLPANFSEWVPYNTSDMEQLAQNLADGKVVYYNGQYWASPEYTNRIVNEIVVYEHDISQD